MFIGFSNGCLKKIGVGRFSPEVFDALREVGCNAIELHCRKISDAEMLPSVTAENLRGFDYVSIHAPSVEIEYRDDAATRKTLDLIAVQSKRLGVKTVVIHPDRIVDWNIFQDYKLPLAIENMDATKKIAHTPEDMAHIFSQHDYKMVFDIQHAFANDSSLRSAQKMLDLFSDRIVQIHLSGFAGGHVPLVETRQTQMIEMLRGLSYPIIIESPLTTREQLPQELALVKQYSTVKV